MARRWNWRFAVAGLAAVAGVAGVVGAMAYRDRRLKTEMPRLDLGQGWGLEVLATTFGTSHVYTVGRWPRLNPVRQRFHWTQGFLGEPTDRMTPGQPLDGLCVFARVTAGGLPSTQDLAWMFASYDEHGCRLPSESSSGSWAVNQQTLTYYMTSLLPRRAREFELGFGSHQAEVGRVRVRNPNPWTGTEWVPEPLPATREVGGLRISLLGFAEHPRWPVPTFRVEAAGVEQPDWVPRETWYRDVTGNAASQPDLCRHEPAWRIAVAFARRPESVTEPRMRWSTDTVGVPEGGSLEALSGQAMLEGVEVRPVFFGGPGSFRLELGADGAWACTERHPVGTPGQPKGNATSSTHTGAGGGATAYQLAREVPWMAIHWTGLTPDHAFDVALVDEGGTWHRTRGWRSGGGLQLVDFPALPSGTKVRGVVVVQTMRRVEFLVKPPPPRAGEARGPGGPAGSRQVE